MLVGILKEIKVKENRVCMSLGLLFGTILPRTELAAPLVMVSSLPLVFSAGFVWPVESIPRGITLLSELAPSTSGIQGFLMLNQMGATFPEVFTRWLWLLFLCLLFSTSAWFVLRRRLNRGRGPLLQMGGP